MAVQRLEYRFTESGLDDLRDDMQALADDTETVGDEATDTAAEMDAAVEDMEDSLEGVEDQVEELQDALNSVSTRQARRALSRLEDAADGVNMDEIAASAASASAAIESEMEDAEDSLVGVGVAGLEAGEAIESGAEDGEDAYEDLTAQVLAAKAAIESIDGAGPDTDVDINQSVQQGGGVGLGALAALAALRETFDKLFGSGSQLAELNDSVSELEFRTTDGAGITRATPGMLEDDHTIPSEHRMDLGEAGREMVESGREAGDELEDGAEDAADELRHHRNRRVDDDSDADADADRRRSTFGTASLANGFHGLARAVGSAVARLGALGKTTLTLGTVLGGTLLTLGAFDIAAATAATGLTALATKLALDFGTDDLKKDLQAVGAQYKETAERFVEAFEPILRDVVIPALQTFNKWLRANIDGLKAFVTERIPQMREFVGSIMFLMQAFGRLGDALTSTGIAGAVSDGLQYLATQLFILADVIESVTDFFSGGEERQTKRSPIRAQNQAPFSGGGEIEGDYTVESGSEEEVQFGPTGNEDVDRGALVDDKLGPVMNGMAKQIARIRERAEQGLISQEEMLRQIVSARETAFNELQKLAQKFPSISDALIDFLAGQVKQARRKLNKTTLQNATEQPADAEKVEPAGIDGLPFPMKTPAQIAGMGDQVRGLGGGLSAFKGAAEGVDSIEDINSLIGSVRKNFDTLNNDEARAFIGRLQKMRTEMEKAKAKADALQGVAVNGLRRFTSGIGSALGDALFPDPDEIQQLRSRRRNIQQNLRQAREAGNYGQIRQLSSELDKVNKKLKQTETIAGRIGKAFSNFGNIAAQALEQVISKLASAAAFAVILGPILGVSGAGFGSIFTSALSGGKIPGLAKGGIVTDSTLAMVGEGTESEAVMPLSKLETLIQPQTPSAQPASTSGSATNVNVNVQTEARIEGSDLVVGIRKALNEEAAIGGPGTL